MKQRFNKPLKYTKNLELKSKNEEIINGGSVLSKYDETKVNYEKINQISFDNDEDINKIAVQRRRKKQVIIDSSDEENDIQQEINDFNKNKNNLKKM
jgi:hypothetical protein